MAGQNAATRRREGMVGAGAGQKSVGGVSPPPQVMQVREQVMSMDMSMWTDRRFLRISATVLLTIYSTILTTGFVSMFWTDPPDRKPYYGERIVTIGAVEHDPFPTAGIIRHIYDIEGLCTVNVSAEPFSISGDEGAQEPEAFDTEATADERLIAYFGYTPTPDEIDLFYQTVQAECGNTEPDDGIGAVADVIANRCRSDCFPDTISEVITQKNQFETWGNGAVSIAEPNERVLEICDEHISTGAVYTDIYFFTAGEYNEYCEPAFVIGHHYFGTLKEE